MTNLLSMIPRFFQETLEFPEIMKAWEKGLGDFEGNIKGVWDNQYIQTCDEDTLSLYEKILGIIPSGDETLEYRRQIVLNKYSMTVPFSEGFLRSRLTEMFGENGYDLTINSQTSTAVLIVKTSVPSGLDLAYNLWLGIAPAHVELQAHEEGVSNIDGHEYFGAVVMSGVYQEI